MAHGCQAGLQEETRATVYRDRILRGREHYTWHKLGAYGSELGAQACFFEQPWTRLSPAITRGGRAWLLNETAFCLRALGRLTEALEPMRAGMEMEASKEHWQNAAIGASNLSELELTLGEVAGAVGDAEQSVTYADHSGDAFQRMTKRITHADALHQAGRRDEAEARFREAEALQAERQPDYPLLYSLQGFKYCDLLLAAPERAAWRDMLGRARLLPSREEPTITAEERLGGSLALPDLLAPCRAVSQRATQTLQWAERSSAGLLTIALDHLTLGRAALYAAILEPSDIQNPKSEIDHAVAGLRRAGQQDQLPKGLPTRAWLRYLTGVRTGSESAQSDLDEAWEIAERGPMPLFLADIHLYRARLFGTPHPTSPRAAEEQEEYPWESPEHDLREARRLIEKHGYLRRKEELEDAEHAIL